VLPKDFYVEFSFLFSVYNKHTCITMFTVALFTIAKPWKQPRCPITDE
jgi:hypothetical protein